MGCMCVEEMLLPDSCSGYAQIMTKCLASFQDPTASQILNSLKVYFSVLIIPMAKQMPPKCQEDYRPFFFF